MSTIAHRQHSVTGRTCCICDRPCAILDCQCLENFQHNTSEHAAMNTDILQLVCCRFLPGSLMKRLTSAFSMPVSAKDLHSFSLCCSCEHHLIVIEQANRIKECIKQVFLETREHRRFVSNHMLKHGKPPTSTIIRQKRLSSAIDSRSFDEASPRVKKSRIASSSSFPTSSHLVTANVLSPAPHANKSVPAATTVFSFDDSNLKVPKVDSTVSFDSVFLPGVSSTSMPAPPDKVISEGTQPGISSDTSSNMEYEEPANSAEDSK